MSLSTRLKNGVNKLLAPLNLRVDSRAKEKLEVKILGRLNAAGHFEKPVFPVLRQFQDCDPSAILAEVAKHERRFDEFSKAPRGGGEYSLDNDYFNSPDAEVLYAVVHLQRPRTIIEVGSGNSTLLFRHAIKSSHLDTRLISIDPDPRREIAGHSDEVIRERVEDLRDNRRFSELNANDILFIDSSHEVKPRNDVLFLLLKVLPSLRGGVVIHIHDIFLPYEYPRRWLMIEKWDWAEQYLVQAMLQGSTTYEVLWPGHYIQRSNLSFKDRFVHWRGDDAKSLWLRKR